MVGWGFILGIRVGLGRLQNCFGARMGVGWVRDGLGDGLGCCFPDVGSREAAHQNSSETLQAGNSKRRASADSWYLPSSCNSAARLLAAIKASGCSCATQGLGQFKEVCGATELKDIYFTRQPHHRGVCGKSRRRCHPCPWTMSMLPAEIPINPSASNGKSF